MWVARVLERSESKEKLIRRVLRTVKYREAGAAALFKRDAFRISVGCHYDDRMKRSDASAHLSK